MKGNTRDLPFKWLLGNDELCKETLKEHVRKWISKENQEGDNNNYYYYECSLFYFSLIFGSGIIKR